MAHPVALAVDDERGTGALRQPRPPVPAANTAAVIRTTWIFVRRFTLSPAGAARFARSGVESRSAIRDQMRAQIEFVFGPAENGELDD